MAQLLTTPRTCRYLDTSAPLSQVADTVTPQDGDGNPLNDPTVAAVRVPPSFDQVLLYVNYATGGTPGAAVTPYWWLPPTSGPYGVWVPAKSGSVTISAVGPQAPIELDIEGDFLWVMIPTIDDAGKIVVDYRLRKFTMR